MVFLSLETADQYEEFVKKMIPKVADVLGLKPRKLYVRMTDMIPVLALTHETTIFLSSGWFTHHPEDCGTIIHELAHAAIERALWVVNDQTQSRLGEAMHRLSSTLILFLSMST